MSLTIQQVYTYANGILIELSAGSWQKAAEGILSEHSHRERVGYFGYGLNISGLIGPCHDSGCKVSLYDLKICYGYENEIVFEMSNQESVTIYKPGDWELILKELFDTEISKVRARKRYREDWEVTRNFLLRGAKYLPFFGYRDNAIKMTVYREYNKRKRCFTDSIYRISVHVLCSVEKKHWWSASKRWQVVFDSYEEGDKKFQLFVDGEWKAYLARVFEEKRLECKARWEESQPTVSERLEQIRGNQS